MSRTAYVLIKTCVRTRFFHKTHRAQCTAHRACQLLCKSYLKCFKREAVATQKLFPSSSSSLFSSSSLKFPSFWVSKRSGLQSAKVRHPTITLRDAQGSFLKKGGQEKCQKAATSDIEICNKNKWRQFPNHQWTPKTPGSFKKVVFTQKATPKGNMWKKLWMSRQNNRWPTHTSQMKRPFFFDKNPKVQNPLSRFQNPTAHQQSNCKVPRPKPNTKSNNAMENQMQ